MFQATVPLERLVHVECGREETRVLARRVVVKRRERLPIAAELFGGRPADGSLRPTFEVFHTDPQASKPGGDRVHVERSAAVRAGGECDLGIAEPEVAGGSGLDERNGLERLDSRARVDRALDVSPAPVDRAVHSDNRCRAAVGALHHGTPNHLDENRIGGHLGPYVRVRAKS